MPCDRLDRLRIREIAEEIARQAVLYRNQSDLDDSFLRRILAKEISNGFEELEQRVLMIEFKSIPKNGRFGFTGTARTALRAGNIRSRRGYGDGCDTCGGLVATFMTLTIGGWKARLTLDLCEPCAKRLAAVVDARLEDRTSATRRKNGVLR